MFAGKRYVTDALEIAVRHHPRFQEMEGELKAAKGRLKAHKQEVGAFHRQINDLRRQLAASEQGLEQTINQRDHREEQINNIIAALGSDAEWSNHCDLGDLAVELVESLRHHLAEADRLAEQRLAADWGLKEIERHNAAKERDAALERERRLREALETIRRCKWPKELVGWTTMDCERLNWVLDVADKAIRDN